VNALADIAAAATGDDDDEDGSEMLVQQQHVPHLVLIKIGAVRI
jgi:hypothetical protein